MNYLILVSHGELAMGVHTALEMMCGDREEVMSTSLKDGEDTSEFKLKFEKLIDKINFEEDKLVVCADIQGGSPFTTSVGVLNDRGVLDKCTIFAGLNLAMAVTACIMKDNLEGDMLVDTILSEAKMAITHFTLDQEDEEEDF